MSTLFDQICSKVNQAPDRRGQVYIPCPACGKESSRKNVHFVFSETKGAICFVCGYKASLKMLAERLGVEKDAPYKPPVYHVAAPKTIRAWEGMIENHLENASKQAKIKWKAYKPIDDTVIDNYRLGWGFFPKMTSQCAHERLLVPLIAGGKIVGLRGRAVDCQCPKWLSILGSEPKFLYNGGQLSQNNEERLQRHLGLSTSPFARGEIILIVENPIDALMVEQSANVRAIATLGVTSWCEEWTQSLVECRPALILVVYDNDLAGNTSNPELIAKWRKKNPMIKDAPTPNGVRLVNNLLRAGLPASLYHWPAGSPEKADIGMLLSETSCPF
jgi:hypothetical protein